MRVAAFLLVYPPDRANGAAQMSADLLSALAEAGHEVTVYSDFPCEARVQDGVTVLPRSAFRKGVRSADLVYTHPDLGTIGPLVARSWGVPLVGVVHNVGERNREALRQYPPDFIVWNAEATRAALGQGLDRPGIVVRSPLRVADHKASRRHAKAVTLINLCEEKGAPLFFDLAGDFPSVPFLGVKGGYGVQLTPPAHLLNPPTPTPANGLTPTGGVRVVESVPPSAMRAEVWARTRVLLVPSVAESWGRAAVEACCSGIPVLASPTPGLVEALGGVDSGGAGLFIDRADRDEWSKRLNELLSNPDLYAFHSEAASRRAAYLQSLTLSDREEWVRRVGSLA